MPDRFFPRAAIVAALAVAAACAPAPTPNEINFSDEGMSQGVAVASRAPRSEIDRIGIGKSINTDNTIKDSARTFGANDTVFASARVSGRANSGIVRAVWFDAQGQPVHEQTRIVSPSRGETVAVQAVPETGWTPGEYTVEIFLDDRLAATERFVVEGEARAAGA